MKGSEISSSTSPIIKNTTNNNNNSTNKPQKPPFRPAEDDSKPCLQDPITRSDPIETEEAVLRLPPFTFGKPKP